MTIEEMLQDAERIAKENNIQPKLKEKDRKSKLIADNEKIVELAAGLLGIVPQDMAEEYFENSDEIRIVTDFKKIVDDYNAATKNEETRDKLRMPFESVWWKANRLCENGASTVYFFAEAGGDVVQITVLGNESGWKLLGIAYAEFGERITWKTNSAQGIVLEHFDKIPKGYRKRLRDYKKAWDYGYKKELDVMNEYICGEYAAVMWYINTKLEEARAEKKDKAKTTTTQRQVIDDPKPKKDKGKRYIQIGDVKIVCPRGSTTTRQKIMHRHMEVWGVRGHWRVYKSGKRVWVRPFKKGKKRDELEPESKVYLLGGKDNE